MTLAPTDPKELELSEREQEQERLSELRLHPEPRTASFARCCDVSCASLARHFSSAHDSGAGALVHKIGWRP